MRNAFGIAGALALGLFGLALALAAGRGSGKAGAAASPTARASREPDGLPISRVSDALANAGDDRLERRKPLAVAEEAALPSLAGAEPRRRLARVHGQVRRSGAPVEGFDLSFRAVESGRVEESEEDWSFTDEEGRYEVELQPETRYVVVHDDDESHVTEVVVPAGGSELVLDIYLPRTR